MPRSGPPDRGQRVMVPVSLCAPHHLQQAQKVARLIYLNQSIMLNRADQNSVDDDQAKLLQFIINTVSSQNHQWYPSGAFSYQSSFDDNILQVSIAVTVGIADERDVSHLAAGFSTSSAVASGSDRLIYNVSHRKTDAVVSSRK